MKMLWVTFLAAAIAFQAYSAEVRLIDAIAVQAPDITLGEIAIIDADDPELKEKLIHFVIEPAPNIDRPKLVSAFKIRRLLENADIEGVTVHGSQSSVSTETEIVSDKDIRNVIEEYINEKVSPNVEADIQVIQLPKEWKIPKSEQISITVDAGRTRLGGYLSLVVRAVADDRIFATSRARVNITLYRDAVVLIRPVKRGQRITAQDLDIHRADVTDANGLEIADQQQIIGMESKRNLKVGSFITVNDLLKPMLIERGSINRIIVRNRSIHLSISGAEALQSGREGEMILFSNPMNKNSPLRAKVIRQGLAILALN